MSCLHYFSHVKFFVHKWRFYSIVTALISIFFLSGNSLFAETIVIAQGGTPQMTIMVPNNASSDLQASADELVSFLNQITGSSFQQTTYDPAVGPNAGIVLGRGTDLAITDELPEPGTNIKTREHHQISTGNTGSYIFLTGTTDLAVRNAVYDFLEQLGCRWYFASANWSIIPELSTLQWTSPSLIRSKNVTMGQKSIAMNIYIDDEPDFKMRHIWAEYAKSTGEWGTNYLDFEIWGDRNRNNQGISISAAHAYGKISSWAADEGTWNNDYWSLIDGVRVTNSQFCVSNTSLQQLCKDYAIDYFNDNPDSDCVSIEPNDGSAWCECASCQAIQNISTGFVTDRTILLSNYVAGQIPSGKYVGQYAYNMHSAIPVTQTPAANLYVLVALGFTHGVDPNDLVALWSPLLQNMGIRDYFDVFVWGYNMPGGAKVSNLNWLQDNLPFYYINKADVYNSESTNSWGPNGLGFYIANKLMWDINADVDSLKQEFLDKCFGSAAETMEEFYDLIDQSHPYPVCDHLMGLLFRCLQDARTLESDSAVVARLDDLTLWLQYCELRRTYINASGTSRQAAAEQMLRFAWKIRSTNMMDSLCLWRTIDRDTSFAWPVDGQGNPLTWSTPEAEHPWKETGTYSHAEIVQMNEDGVDNNDLLDDDPCEFSADLVPSYASASSRGSTYITRGLNRLYIMADENGDLPVLSVATGYSYSYDLDWSLYRAGEPEDTEHELMSGTVVADQTYHNVSFNSYEPNECFVFVYDDKTGSTNIDWPAASRVSYAASMTSKLWQHGRVTRRYFYVPKGTDNVLFAADSLSNCNFYTANGTLKLAFAGGSNVNLSIPVGTGEDNQIWYVTGFSSKNFFFWNIPALLAKSPDELLIPREAYASLMPSMLNASTRGNFNFTRGVVYLYLYADANGDLPGLTITNGYSYDRTATWSIYKEGESTVLQSGTIPPDVPTNLTFNTQSEGAYLFVYDDDMATSKLEWTSSSLITYAASDIMPLTLWGRVTRRYFYVPEGTVTIQATTNSISDCNFYTANGTLKLAHPGSSSAVNISIPVDSGEDGQIWYVTGIYTRNFKFTNIPGYMAVNSDELLVPKWLYNEINN